MSKMQKLAERVTQLRCRAHQRPIHFINTSRGSQYVSRGMCHRCLHPSNTNGLMSIENVLDFIEEQDLKEKTLMEQFITNSREYLEHKIQQIIESLMVIVDQLEASFQQIGELRIINKLEQQYFNRDIELDDIEPLGQLLGNSIELINDKYRLKNEIPLMKREGVIEAKQIIGLSEQVYRILGCEQQQSEFTLNRTTNYDWQDDKLKHQDIFSDTQLIDDQGSTEEYFFND